MYRNTTSSLWKALGQTLNRSEQSYTGFERSQEYFDDFHVKDPLLHSIKPSSYKFSGLNSYDRFHVSVKISSELWLVCWSVSLNKKGIRVLKAERSGDMLKL